MLVKIYLDGVKCNEKNITYDTISQICLDSIPKNINANILICSSAEGYVKELDRIIYYNKNFYCKKQSWLHIKDIMRYVIIKILDKQMIMIYNTIKFILQLTKKI